MLFTCCSLYKLKTKQILHDRYIVCFLNSKDFPAFVRVCYQPETADLYVKRCALAIFRVTTTASLRTGLLCRRASVRTFRNVVVPSSVSVGGLGGVGR